jgi:hypothetical protein
VECLGVDFFDSFFDEGQTIGHHNGLLVTLHAKDMDTADLADLTVLVERHFLFEIVLHDVDEKKSQRMLGIEVSFQKKV